MKYEKLSVYIRSRQFGIDALRFTAKIPNRMVTETVGRQLVRASMSISANIAEGSAASTRTEFRRFIQIALRSAVESRHWLNVLRALGYTTSIEKESAELVAILTAILKRLRNS